MNKPLQTKTSANASEPFYVVSDMRAFELFARGKSKDDYPAFEFD
jgi:hypothetical protein